MSTRIWVYDQMSDVTLQGMVPGGVHESTSLEVAPHQKPFITYRQTSDVSRFRGDDGEQVRAVGFMIMAHDMPGDYLAIDDIMTQLQTLFRDIVDQARGVVKSFWLETSEDQRDDDMGTILKWGRIQVLYKV